jgi:hypothetical protein
MMAGLCVAGVAFAQSQGVPEQSQTLPGQTNPSATVPEPATPGQAGGTTATPDQANSATYPAAADNGSSDPGAVSTPQQPDGNAQTSQSAQTPDPNAAASKHQKSTMRSAAADSSGGITPGMDVTGRSGEAVGTVVDVVRSSSGGPAYVVIADQAGSDTAVPIAVARHMVHGNKVVVDTKRLQNAPKVPESQLQNPSSTQWQGKADSYWGKGGTEKDRG